MHGGNRPSAPFLPPLGPGRSAQRSQHGRATSFSPLGLSNVPVANVYSKVETSSSEPANAQFKSCLRDREGITSYYVSLSLSPAACLLAYLLTYLLTYLLACLLTCLHESSTSCGVPQLPSVPCQPQPPRGAGEPCPSGLLRGGKTLPSIAHLYISPNLDWSRAGSQPPRVLTVACSTHARTLEKRDLGRVQTEPGRITLTLIHTDPHTAHNKSPDMRGSLLKTARRVVSPTHRTPATQQPQYY